MEQAPICSVVTRAPEKTVKAHQVGYNEKEL